MALYGPRFDDSLMDAFKADDVGAMLPELDGAPRSDLTGHSLAFYAATYGATK